MYKFDSTPAGETGEIGGKGRNGRKGYWGGIVGQYQPTPGVSRRRGHSAGGLGRKRHQGATASSNRSNLGGT